MLRILLFISFLILPVSAFEYKDVYGSWIANTSSIEDEAFFEVKEYISFKKDSTFSNTLSMNMDAENATIIIKNLEIKVDGNWKLYRDMLIFSIQKVEVVNDGTIENKNKNKIDIKEIRKSLIQDMQNNSILVDRVKAIKDNTMVTIDENGMRTEYKHLISVYKRLLSVKK